jgi:hypothetical protein
MNLSGDEITALGQLLTVPEMTPGNQGAVFDVDPQRYAARPLHGWRTPMARRAPLHTRPRVPRRADPATSAKYVATAAYPPLQGKRRISDMEDLKSIRTPDLLDEAKRRLRLTSDYKLAQALGWLHGTLSSYRNGRTSMDVPQAAHFCKTTGIPFEAVAAAVINDRASRDTKTRRAVTSQAA